MSAPIGNQFWKMRSKHGRDKIFSDPNIMLQACYDYFNYQSGADRAWNKKEAVKGGEFTGQIIDVPTATPFSFRLLCAYLHVHSKYFLEFEQGLKPNESQKDKDFSDVITHVREIIEEQQLEGATVGAFNANIISRRLGLADKINSEHTGKDGKPIETKNNLTINVVTNGKEPANSEKEIQDAIDKELRGE